MIRSLDPATEREAVLDLYQRAADYVDFESGRTPDAAMVEDYFSDAPPGGDPATSLKLGLFEDGRLAGIADVAFGYPKLLDAYVGLMLLAPEAQGRGLGQALLRHIEQVARDRGATRLLLAVLETNAKGRAFWEREGFASPRVYPAVPIGQRAHVRVRLEKRLRLAGTELTTERSR